MAVVPSARMVDPVRLESALRRGLEHVVDEQRSDGLWSSGDGGSVWLSAQIGLGLGPLAAVPMVVDLVRGPLSKLTAAVAERQAANGGWPARSGAGTDLETACWAICLLQRSLHFPVAARAARQYVLWHRESASGGFSRFSIADGRGAADGCSPDVCSTALAVQALVAVDQARADVVAAAGNYLVLSQQEDGLWRCPRWPGAGVPTTLAVTALVMTENSPGQVMRAARVGLRKLACADEPYDVAMSLIAQMVVGEPGMQDAAAVHALLASQQSDGYWSGPQAFHVPGAPGALADETRTGTLLATAAALVALSISLSQMRLRS